MRSRTSDTTFPFVRRSLGSAETTPQLGVFRGQRGLQQRNSLGQANTLGLGLFQLLLTFRQERTHLVLALFAGNRQLAFEIRQPLLERADRLVCLHPPGSFAFESLFHPSAFRLRGRRSPFDLRLQLRPLGFELLDLTFEGIQLPRGLLLDVGDAALRDFQLGTGRLERPPRLTKLDLLALEIASQGRNPGVLGGEPARRRDSTA